jgi:hypothetical protein
VVGGGDDDRREQGAGGGTIRGGVGVERECGAAGEDLYARDRGVGGDGEA